MCRRDTQCTASSILQDDQCGNTLGHPKVHLTKKRDPSLRLRHFISTESPSMMRAARSVASRLSTRSGMVSGGRSAIRMMSSGQYFPSIGQIKYEGASSSNPLAFRHYDPEAIIEGKVCCFNSQESQAGRRA